MAETVIPMVVLTPSPNDHPLKRQIKCTDSNMALDIFRFAAFFSFVVTLSRRRNDGIKKPIYLKLTEEPKNQWVDTILGPPGGHFRFLMFS